MFLVNSFTVSKGHAWLDRHRIQAVRPLQRLSTAMLLRDHERNASRACGSFGMFIGAKFPTIRRSPLC